MKNFETNEEIIYALIIDDLDETITVEDKQILEHWRSVSDDNEKLYQDFLNIQVNMDKLYEQRGYESQASWDVLVEKLDATHVIPSNITRKINVKMWFGIAASLLVLFSFGYFLSIKNRYEVIKTESSSAHVVLPDGTQVDLNLGTAIRYSKKDFLNDRRLELLNGEIFINVTNHALPQFRVSLGEVEAMDIGTSFNIIKTDKKVNIIVENGKVALRKISSENEVLLTPGKLGTYDQSTKALISSDNLDLNYKSWISKEFVFSEVPLADVAGQLEKVYRTPIVIKGNSLKNRKLTAKLHYKTLDSTIAVISASLQCKAIQFKGTYILSEN